MKADITSPEELSVKLAFGFMVLMVLMIALNVMDEKGLFKVWDAFNVAFEPFAGLWGGSSTTDAYGSIANALS